MDFTTAADKTFIIAEAGLAHGGHLSTAKLLAVEAQKAGADAVKFQTWFHSDWEDLEQFKMSKDQWTELFDYCDDLGITWFSTPFDGEAIEFLDSLGMNIWKIPSGMVTNYLYLAKIRSIKPCRVILSTGMASVGEILDACSVFNYDCETLYCVSHYPADYSEIDLNCFITEQFDGISDHTVGIEIPIAAVALGATIVEKHFHLDFCTGCPDHACSLSATEFSWMVRSIRHVEQALQGDGYKEPTAHELQVRDAIRKRMGA
jgi:N,N'-diacetyllegionaminate synthase